MRRKRAMGTVLAACLACSGCYRATFASARTPSQETHEVWLDGFLFGAVSGSDVDTRFYCADEPASVGVFESPLSWGLTLITLGVYTPRVASITCASTGAIR